MDSSIGSAKKIQVPTITSVGVRKRCVCRKEKIIFPKILDQSGRGHSEWKNSPHYQYMRVCMDKFN